MKSDQLAVLKTLSFAKGNTGVYMSDSSALTVLLRDGLVRRAKKTSTYVITPDGLQKLTQWERP